MALDKEIAEVFHRVVELDLERVSRSAVPSYHFFTSSPPYSMYEGEKVDVGNPRIVLTHEDFQAARVEINPLGIKHVDQDLAKIVAKRKKRHMKDSALENNFFRRRFEEAYHEYIGESTRDKPIPIEAKAIVTGKATAKIPIISVEDVDYVLEEFLTSSKKYDEIKGDLSFVPYAIVDQWPEELVLRDASDPKNDRIYIRADVAFYDDQGAPQDLRFRPRWPPTKPVGPPRAQAKPRKKPGPKPKRKPRK